MNYYEFNDSKCEIKIYRHALKSPWINYLSNGRMHAFISQAGGGFAWWENPLNYRITRYRMYNLPIDSPGFYVYIRRKDGTAWSPTFRPCETVLDDWCAAHMPGKTVFQARKGDLEAKLAFFISADYDTLVWDLELSNKSSENVEVDVFAYVELSQLVWKQEIFSGYYWRHMLKTWYDSEMESLLYLHHFQYHPEKDKVPLVYFASTEPVKSYSGSRDDFMGPYRDERNPLGVERGYCGNENLSCGEPCAALQNTLLISGNSAKRVCFFLGVVPGALVDFARTKSKIAEDLSELRKPGTVDEQCEKIKMWWEKHLDIYKCTIPDKDAQRQINIWNPVNCVHTARYSRSVNTNAPGVRGIGFRDTCQDMLAIAYRNPEWAEETLMLLLSWQYKDGHCVHTIPTDKNDMPDIGIHCDNHLWLPLLAYSIIAEKGDFSLLERKAPYLADDHISFTEPATVWEHLLAAIHFTEEHLGAHGLPLTLKGDWNDIIGKFSQRGHGESVFAGQQYVKVLKIMTEIAEAYGDYNSSKWLKENMVRQEKALLDCAWDGKWWLRGFDDDGNPVGSVNSEFGKLFLNPQSWAVISGVGEPWQLKEAMEAVHQHLDTGIGIKKLMPGFKTWPDVSDSFTGYGPGCGENGAIFCHANAWAIIAEALLGNGSRAWKYFTQIIPHNVLNKVGIDKYQAEPYAWVSNIVGPENPRFGWANVCQITGTAAWMDVAATQYLLGIRPVIGGICIDPCIPANWKSLSISRIYQGCRLNIDIDNRHGVEKGMLFVFVDGKAVDFDGVAVIPSHMIKGKSVVNIRACMGQK